MNPIQVGPSFDRQGKVVEAVVDRTEGQRVLLWVDCVGGYLVCTSPSVSLGQAGPEGNADIRLMADISRTHARLTRQDDLYVLTPLGPTWLRQQRLRSDALLADGDLVQLGTSVRFRFRQPHPLSSSAQIEMLSPHRPEPAADGCLLMAHSLVLGPHPTSHIVCKDWESEVVLFQAPGGTWSCRSTTPMAVNGHPTGSPTPIPFQSRVCGTDFCFSLEPLG